MTFELLLHAAFVADEDWINMLQPARINYPVNATIEDNSGRGKRKEQRRHKMTRTQNGSGDLSFMVSGHLLW